jgi:H+/Cl- antiporter ClcA
MVDATDRGPDAEPGVSALVRLCLIGAGVGLVAAAGAAGFVAVNHHLSHWLWHGLPEQLGAQSAPWWLVLSLPVLGAALTAGAMRLPGGGGHSPLDGLRLDIGPRHVGSFVLASLASLGFGAVLGPEAPLIAIGAAAGAAAIRSPNDPARQVMMIVGAMAAAGAIFGNPLVTTILLLELALAGGARLASPAVLLPSMTGLAGGFLLQGGLGPWTGLGSAQLSLDGLAAYPEVRVLDLLWGVPLAVMVAVVTMAALRGGTWWRGVHRGSGLVRLLLSGAVVGASALAVTLVTDEPAQLVLMSGQGSMGEYLALGSVGTALLVLVAKFVAYAVSLGGGFRGGIVFPAIALGTILATLGTLLLGTEASAGLVATAIGAAVAASLRLPFTAVLLAVLLTISAGGATTVPAILGAIVGFLARVSGERFIGIARA